MRAAFLKAVLLFILMSGTLFAQDARFEWTKQFSGTKSQGNIEADEGKAVAVDNSGNIYLLLEFKGVMDADPGDDVQMIGGAKENNIAIMKLSHSGKLLWYKSFGNEKYSDARNLNIDKDNNIYVAGTFTGTIDFDGGPNIQERIAKSSEEFILKLSSEGEFIWVKSFEALGNALTVDSQGNIFSVGYFAGRNDFDPGEGEFYFEEYDDWFGWYSNGYILKLDPDGNFVWAKHLRGTKEVIPWGVATDSTGNIYVTGDFSDTLRAANLAAISEWDGFIIKYNGQGDVVWAKQWESATGWTIAVDRSGNVITAGGFVGATDLDPGPGIANADSSGSVDMFVVKLDSLGDFIWGNAAGGNYRDMIRSIAIDELGDIYTTGYFAGSVDFNTGDGSAILTTPTLNCDVFIEKFYASGNFAWAKQLSGDYNQYGFAITIDRNGNIYTTGNFSATVDFDPGKGVYELSEKTEEIIECAAGDAFLHKMYQMMLMAPNDLIVNKTQIQGERELQWKDNSNNERGFIIERSADEKNWLIVDSVGADITSFLDNGLNENFLYSYKVSAYSDAGRSDYSVAQEDAPATNISETYESNRIEVFPNPTTDKITIENPFKTEQNIRIEIYTLEGILLKEFSAMLEPKLHIDLSGQPQGTYLLKLTSGAESFMAKVNLVK